MGRGHLLAAVVLLCTALAGGTASASLTAPPAISAAALTPGDLNGAKVEEQGYVTDIAGVPRYERDFESVKYGRSRLLYVDSTVILYRSAVDASLALAGMRAAFDPKASSFRSLVTSTFAQHTGGLPSSVSVRKQRTLRLTGTDGAELILRLATPAGRIDGGYAFMQTDRIVGVLTVVSKPGASIAPADLARMDGAFAKRMRATAKRLG